MSINGVIKGILIILAVLAVTFLPACVYYKYQSATAERIGEVQAIVIDKYEDEQTTIMPIGDMLMPQYDTSYKVTFLIDDHTTVTSTSYKDYCSVDKNDTVILGRYQCKNGNVEYRYEQTVDEN